MPFWPPDPIQRLRQPKWAGTILVHAEAVGNSKVAAEKLRDILCVYKANIAQPAFPDKTVPRPLQKGVLRQISF